MNAQKKALICLAIAAALWSTGGVLIKGTAWHPMAIAGCRSIISLFIIWLFFRKEKLSFSRYQLAGAVFYCTMVCLFVIATKMTTAANAIILQYTAPVYVALLAGWLLGEKTTRRDWVTIFWVFFGIVFFFLDKVEAGGIIGNFCAIGSGLSYALFTLFMRLQKDGSPFGSVLLGNLFTALIGIFFWSDITFNTPDLISIILLGVFQLGLPYVIYTRSIKHVQALEATLITTVEPILNPVWVFLCFGEIPGFYSAVGGGIVLLTLFVRYCYDAKAAPAALVDSEPA